MEAGPRYTLRLHLTDCSNTSKYVVFIYYSFLFGFRLDGDGDGESMLWFRVFGRFWQSTKYEF